MMLQLRANFTSTSARNAGTFSAYSEEFCMKGANPPKCLALAEATPALNLTNAQSGMATGGLCALPFGLWVLVCVVLCPWRQCLEFSKIWKLPGSIQSFAM
jgi:hypothetical protein